MNVLFSALEQFCLQTGLTSTYWIALSGGLDSSVLLSLCHELKKKYSIQFHVVHFNHRLHARAAEWALFCKERAADYDFPFWEGEVQENRLPGDSIEAYARRARYEYIKKLMQTGDVLLTAHHQDDQAETVLLQLMRGSGIKGLAAMATIKPFARGQHGRPLLSFSRDVFHQYAIEKKLQWIDDPSNADTIFPRNFIRKKIMPLLRLKWPSAATMLARSAEHCRSAQSLLDDCIPHQDCAGSYAHSLSVKKVLALSHERQCVVLRQWIMQAGFYPPDKKKFRTIQETVLKSRWDKMPCVALGEIMLRRYRDDLFLQPIEIEKEIEKKARTITPIHWQLGTRLAIPFVGELDSYLALEGEVPIHYSRLSVSFLQAFETIKVLGRGRHSLKKLFQEWGVPPWQRQLTPLLFLQDELIGVPGYYWSHVLLQETSKEKFKIVFRA